MDEQAKKRLVTTRAVAKASLTRLCKFVNEFQPESDIQLLIVRMKELDNIRDKFENAQTELEINEDFDSHAVDRENFEAAFFEVQAEMTNIINRQSGTNRDIRPGSPSPSHSSMNKMAIKLPTIKLPTFSGDITTFKHFLDTFSSLVVSNDHLDNIQKFHYLLSSLTGEAHALIANIPVTNANFEVAFNTICERYDNLRLIATAHVGHLLNLPTVNKSSVNELRALLNKVISNLNAIKALNLTVSLEDLIVSQLILEKLDLSIRKEYESTLNSKSFPNLEQLCTFLEGKCKSLEIVNSCSTTKISTSSYAKPSDASNKSNKQNRQSYVSTSMQCAYCNSMHVISRCKSFAKAPIMERRDFAKRLNLCFNCLQSGHKVNACKSRNCKLCNKKHHTLVHLDTPVNTSDEISASGHSVHSSGAAQVDSGTSSYCAYKRETRRQILLSTALVNVLDGANNWQTCRALLDSGSQSCFMSESCAQRLKLRRQHNRKPVQGIGRTVSETKHSVTVQVASCSSNFVTAVECLIMPKVTEELPCRFVDAKEWNLPQHLPLADPKFCEPAPIDILLGAEVWSYIQKPGRLVRDADHPVLQETEFGWTLSGKYREFSDPSDASRRPVVSCFSSTETEIGKQLQRFWEIEEIPHTPRTKEEVECEAHFVQNTIRDSTGRFVVRLPFKQDPKILGDSLATAKRRFHFLERKLATQDSLREDYTRFLREYEEMGHMELTNIPAQPCYYMPHHAVLKADSSTTKTRVVFDCSAASSSGASLNDALLVGPTIQQDIYSIIMRFRVHNVAFTADIAKMFRQILLDPRDCIYQRILWKESCSAPLSEYELKTVTYGMASSPFLATRCLQQLAFDEAREFPTATTILLRDFYVDDLISGCATLEEALQLQKELTELLERGGFPLRKWCSNQEEFLKCIPADLRETNLPLQLDQGEVKTLGLLWHPAADQFQIVNSLGTECYPHGFTKRSILSIVSGIFDPLGLISPVVILGKMLLQRLWQEKFDWDQPLSAELTSSWKVIHDQLPKIGNIRIDRRILGHGSLANIELHGFCDASERAYGACIYVRSINHDETITVRLLCSKSRVAPLKKLSLPRLELCGALLLARLFQLSIKALDMKFHKAYLWTDSSVVLAWISAPSTKWKTFVGNRVSEIQERTQTAEWRHVASKENPADLISRGVLPADILTRKLWWEGPHWLAEPTVTWPFVAAASDGSELTEEKTKQGDPTVCHVVTNENDSVVTRYSNLPRLQRVVAYCKRFCNNCRKPREERLSGPLSADELNVALLHCIRLSQLSVYAREIRQLESNGTLHSASKLSSLTPFLDSNHLLRVGGRLQHADLTDDQRHQIILPPNHHLTRLIVEEEHRRLLHAGCQLLLSSLRQRFWVVNGKTTVRQIIHKCLICYRLKAKAAHQLMGQLPPHRVNPTRPFVNCGIDYTGPFYIKTGSRRSKSKVKCYVAIFVCLATRAVHLEVVSDMSTKAFLAALKRFVSRRGRCQTIFCDNGTNFVGAERELREIENVLSSQELNTEVQKFAFQEGITWKFIPPRAPHFGGLWEAGVKSFKHHLRRVMGNMILTFEELTTLTVQIEACLNSRPLIPLSNDPNDPQALTPGHFLIGSALTCLPQPDLANAKLSLLTRWERLQQQLQLFWRRWSGDYLNHLQQRSKWTTPNPGVTPGTVVILKDDNLPPLLWKLAVVEEVHPGNDGLVRVATVRTSSGALKRPIVKLCPLPSEAD